MALAAGTASMVITRAAMAAMRFMLFPSVCLEWPQKWPRRAT
jgi:hypothetical protein